MRIWSFSKLRWSSIVCVALLLPQQLFSQTIVPLDTLVYSDSATAILVQLAQARHQVQTLRFAGYRARVFSRLEGHVGSSRFGPGWTIFKYETAARMFWARNGDLKVDIEGGRMTGTRMPGFGRDQMADFFEEIFGGDIWFIPSAAGDDIDIMGLPDTEALHPFARGAEQFYRYEITDSMRVAYAHRTVRLVNLSVEPRVPSAFVVSDIGRGQDRRTRLTARSLISGRLWIDADSLDVVRLTGAFVGPIWDEDDDAPQLENLEADIEYSLHDDRYWLPHRQVLTAHWTFKYLPGADMVGTGITTFSDHEVDVTDSSIAFRHEESDLDEFRYITRGDGSGTTYRADSWQCPEAWEFDEDSSDPRCGEREITSVRLNHDGTVWEINLPTLDSLRSFDFGDGWNEAIDLASSEALDNAISEIATLGTMSPAVSAISSPVNGVDWKHVYSAVGFNRVQGVSLGGGYQWELWPAFSTLHLNARYGFGDRHLLGTAIWRRDAPSGRFELTTYRAVKDQEPWTDGTGVGNSLKALAFGHDDADYYFAPFGFGLSFRGYGGTFSNGYLSLKFERQESMSHVSSSPLTGNLQPNPPISGGDFVSGILSRSWFPGFSGKAELTVGLEGLMSRDSAAGRVWGYAYVPYGSETAIASLATRLGAVGGSQLPQMRYRLGGPYTVRGYEYGVMSGRRFWSTQGELEWVVCQWWSPIIFADVGGINFSDTPLVGAGAGVSLLSGWARATLAKGLTNGGGFRFDVSLGVPPN